MLTGKQKHYLRSLAHHRKPVVSVGTNGVTEAVLREVDEALTHHELVKVKLPAVEPAQKKSILETVCAATQALRVQIIGRTGIVYRPAAEPKISMPNS